MDSIRTFNAVNLGQFCMAIFFNFTLASLYFFSDPTDNPVPTKWLLEMCTM